MATTQSGVGLSHHRNPVQAGREAVLQAMKNANLEACDLVIMFATVGYDQNALVKAVREASGRAPLMGGSGEGIIANDETDESNYSVGVMVLKSDEMKLTPFMTTGLKANPVGAGERLAEQANRHITSETKALVLFADGLTLNYDAFYQGLSAKLSTPLPLFGGTSGDNFAMAKTYQYCNDEVMSDGVVGATLNGNVRLAWDVNHGCVPIGLERTVTRSEANRLYEIDGKPVLEVIKEYLSEEELENRQKAVNNLCLGFKTSGPMAESYGEFVIRTCLSIDDNDGSITIPTEVKPGTKVWMTRRDHEKIERGIERLAQSIKSQLKDNQAKLVLQFDCAGRGKIVFRDDQRSGLLRKLREGVDTKAPWLGCYTFGEIGPVGKVNSYHNYTAVVAALY